MKGQKEAKKQREAIMMKLEDLKIMDQLAQEKDDDNFDFFEKNLTDVWKEIGQIKAKMTDEDQSSFTNLNSLNNELRR